MSEAGDDRKGPSDAGTITPGKDVTRSRGKRGSRTRKSISSTSTPMKELLEHERDTATVKRGKFFSNAPVTDNVSGNLVYKVTATVKIDGITYQVGEVVQLDTVERWSKTPDDSGEPTPDRDSDAEDYKDSGDPDDINSNIYPSPLINGDPYWCWSHENKELIKVAMKPNMVVPTGSIFTQPAVNAGSINYQAVKEKFVYSSTNPFKFYKLSFAAVREIQDIVVAHFRKTIRADQEYSLFDTFKDELRRDIVIRLRTHKEYAARPGNSHRRDGLYLENDITENFLSQLEPVYMLPLLLIATLPLIDTAGKGSHESTVMAILRYEAKRFMMLHSGYFTDRMALFQNYTKIHEGIRAMTAEILKFTKITEWWMNKWYPVKSYNTNITSWTELLTQAFSSSGTNVTLHDLYSLWAVTDKRYRHFSHLLKDKLSVSWKMEQDCQPSAAHLMKLDGILDKHAKPHNHFSRSSSPSAKSTSSGHTTKSSSSTASTSSNSSNTSSLTTNNIGNTVDTDQVDTINNVTPYTKPTTAHTANRPTVSFHNKSDDRPTPVCYVQLVKGICNKVDCERSFSHDEAILSKTRKDLIRSWSTGTTMGASRTNNNLLQQLNVTMGDDDDLQDISSFIANMDLDVALQGSTEEELDQE